MINHFILKQQLHQGRGSTTRSCLIAYHIPNMLVHDYPTPRTLQILAYNTCTLLTILVYHLLMVRTIDSAIPTLVRTLGIAIPTHLTCLIILVYHNHRRHHTCLIILVYHNHRLIQVHTMDLILPTSH